MLENLTKHELLDVIFYFEEHIKKTREPLTVQEFYETKYPILKQLQEITEDNKGPIHCYTYILDTRKAPMVEFCESCEKWENGCQGVLPVQTLRDMLVKYKDYLE